MYIYIETSFALPDNTLSKVYEINDKAIPVAMSDVKGINNIAIADGISSKISSVLISFIL